MSAFYVVVRHFPGSTIVRRRHELTVEAVALAVVEELAAGYGSVTVETKELAAPHQVHPWRHGQTD